MPCQDDLVQGPVCSALSRDPDVGGNGGNPLLYLIGAPMVDSRLRLNKFDVLGLDRNLDQVFAAGHGHRHLPHLAAGLRLGGYATQLEDLSACYLNQEDPFE